MHDAPTQTALDNLEPEVDHAALRARLGTHLYRQRMNIQAYHAARAIGQGLTLVHPENILFLRRCLTVMLKSTLTYGWGRTNARKLLVRENRPLLRRLPEAFRGFRVLQVSDLHLDLDGELTEAIAARVSELEFDLCVLTGDFRAETDGSRLPCLRALERFMPSLRRPEPAPKILAILGNHDDLELAAHLESLGVRVLLNESVSIERAGSFIYVAGVDDPHFYETDDFERAMDGIPIEATTLMLSHTAEPYRRALACGVDLMLCGHTHGGQICLPGGVAIMRNARHPRRFNQGAWRYHELQGYTTAGAGCSMLPVRFFCPPEVTFHILDRAPHE